MNMTRVVIVLALACWGGAASLAQNDAETATASPVQAQMDTVATSKALDDIARRSTPADLQKYPDRFLVVKAECASAPSSCVLWMQDIRGGQSQYLVHQPPASDSIKTDDVFMGRFSDTQTIEVVELHSAHKLLLPVLRVWNKGAENALASASPISTTSHGMFTPTGKLEVMIGSGQVLPAYGSTVYVLPQSPYGPMIFDAAEKLANALHSDRAGNNYSGPTEYGCKKTVLELHQALLKNVQAMSQSGSPSAQVVTVDDAGNFRLSGMPPGAYLFVAEGDVGRNTLLWLKNVNVSDFTSTSPVIDFGAPQISCFYVPGF